MKQSIILAGAALFCLAYAPVQAETGPTHPTDAQMKAIHDCAAAKGVELPPPPGRGSHKGEKCDECPPKPPKDKNGDSGPPPGPPPEGGKGKGSHAPLTDEQRAIIDSCFAEQGLTPPPKAPHPHDK